MGGKCLTYIDTEGFKDDKYLPFYSRYDADSQILKVGITPDPVCSDTYDRFLKLDCSSLLYAVKSKWVVEYTSSYTSKNAFGAEIEVQQGKSEMWSLWLRNLGDFDYHKIEIKLSPEEAKKLQQNMAVLFVSKINASYPTSLVMGKVEPTFTKPSELDMKIWYISVELLELWVYDFNTGQVYKKLKKEQTAKKS